MTAICRWCKRCFSPRRDGRRAIRADDSTAITLTLDGEAGAAAAVTLAPSRAVALAGELITAALPKLRAL